MSKKVFTRRNRQPYFRADRRPDFSELHHFSGGLEPVSPGEVDPVILENCEQHICRCTGYVLNLRAIRKVVLNTPGLTH